MTEMKALTEYDRANRFFSSKIFIPPLPPFFLEIIFNIRAKGGDSEKSIRRVLREAGRDLRDWGPPNGGIAFFMKQFFWGGGGGCHLGHKLRCKMIQKIMFGLIWTKKKGRKRLKKANEAEKFSRL